MLPKGDGPASTDSDSIALGIGRKDPNNTCSQIGGGETYDVLYVLLQPIKVWSIVEKITAPSFSRPPGERVVSRGFSYCLLCAYTLHIPRMRLLNKLHHFVCRR